MDGYDKEIYTYGHDVTAPAGSSDEYSLLTVPSTKQFRMFKVKVHFPSGSGYYLQIAVMRGSEQVVPDAGYIVGDNNMVEIDCNKVFIGGQDVKIWYNNTDSANAHTCYVLVEGVFE